MFAHIRNKKNKDLMIFFYFNFVINRIFKKLTNKQSLKFKNKKTSYYFSLK